MTRVPRILCYTSRWLSRRKWWFIILVVTRFTTPILLLYVPGIGVLRVSDSFSVRVFDCWCFVVSFTTLALLVFSPYRIYVKTSEDYMRQTLVPCDGGTVVWLNPYEKTRQWKEYTDQSTLSLIVLNIS